MGRRSNQSALNSLLTQVGSGDNGFKYECKEQKTIDWSKYDTAQINEINDMLESIRDSIDQAVRELNIEARYKEKKEKPGRSTVFPGDLLRITDTFSYKSIERAYANQFVQDILHHLFITTQRPIIGKEHCFSTDGTGAPTSMKYNYETEKHRRKQGEERKLDTFEQLILTVGTEYKLITDLIMTSNPYANESPFLKEAVQRVSSLYEDIDVWTAGLLMQDISQGRTPKLSV